MGERSIEFLEMVDDRFYIQIVTKTTMNCSLQHAYKHSTRDIGYDEMDERGENVEVIIKDLHAVFSHLRFRHVQHMSQEQLYDFILDQIEEYLMEQKGIS